MPNLIKEMLLREIRREFEANAYAFISSFEKMPVSDFSEVRRGLEKVSRRCLVLKHTLAKKVFDEIRVPDATKFLKGQVFVTLGDKDPQVISKAIVALAKTNQKIALSGVVFEGKAYDQEFIKQLARLPSRHELLTQVVVRVKSPISGFVLTLSQLVRGLVTALNEVKKQREVSAQPA